MNISFIPFQIEHLFLWQTWIERPHVKNSWFVEGYETTDYILRKVKGNGYDSPFVIEVDGQALGYIQCCDLYAYRHKAPTLKGVFTHEPLGTFCMDLFISDENYLGKGYGTEIVKAFVAYVFKNFAAQVLLIDPAVSDQRAIRCYEKAGFKFLKTAYDGVQECYVMKIDKNHAKPV